MTHLHAGKYNFMFNKQRIRQGMLHNVVLLILADIPEKLPAFIINPLFTKKKPDTYMTSSSPSNIPFKAKLNEQTILIIKIMENLPQFRFSLQ
jgi:hypothetical protein